MAAVAKSNYLEQKLLDHVFGGPTYTPPATLYFALYTAAPTDSGGGTEITGNGYARAAITNNTTNFGAATGSGKTNASPVIWPIPTASWGTAVALGVFDAASGGNLLYWGLLTTNRLINLGVAPRIEIGGLVITED